MISSKALSHYAFRTTIVALSLLVLRVSHGATIEEETLNWLQQIRAVRTDPNEEVVKAQNKMMDGAWKFFGEHKSDVLPVLRRELSNELHSDHPNQMLLLEIGHYIRLQAGDDNKKLGLEAFLAIDPSSEVIRWNTDSLFNFGHAIAVDRDPQALLQFDKAFLTPSATVYAPQHAMKLDAALIGTFLYGPYGKAGEAHLRSHLGDPQRQLLVIEILSWIGSPRSVVEVGNLVETRKDFDCAARVVTFMMKAGGTEGRQFVLSMHPDSFDQRTQEYLAEVRPAAERMNFETYLDGARKLPAGESPDGEELKKRLIGMYKTYGRDDSLAPMAILNSKLPKAFLIEQLEAIRSRTLFRVSDEALSDVEITNLLLNGLHYRNN